MQTIAPLIAFGWVNLPMLGWLAAAAAPLLIHLWSRRKHREMPWAAMEYLLTAVKLKARRLRFDQWLLLAIRTLLIVLLVLAVAEPYAARSSIALPATCRTHHLLVIDGSYSMGYQPSDKTRFERAKELARQIVEESPQGDGFTLVLMASTPRIVVGTPAMEPSEILQEIENLQLQHTSADLPMTVASIAQVLEGVQREYPRLTRHEIYFLTDLQRVTWEPKLPRDANAEFRKQTEQLSRNAAIYLIDLGQAQADNLAVTGLRASDAFITVDHDVRLTADLKIFGRQSHHHQPIELFVDRRRVDRKYCDVTADSTATVEFSYRFDTPVDHAIEVHAPGDALEVDNCRYLAMPVHPSIRVLCINGRPSGTSFRGATDYLAVALAPEAERHAHPLIQAEVASESAILERNLTAYDCVFLCNVAQFTANEARVLDAYLQNGGSLVFFLGDQVVAESYNRELGSQQSDGDNGGVLPAEIGPLVEQSQLRLDPLGYAHPILQAFRGRGEASLQTTPVFKYLKLAVPPNSRSKVVLATGSGDPLIIEAPNQRGRVVLVGTSADPSWTAMPLWPSFVPLVQEIVAWCVRGQLERRNLMVGEPLDVNPDASDAAGAMTLLTPDGRSHTFQPDAEESSADYNITTQSGIYQIQTNPPLNTKELFAVNIDTAESDLTQANLMRLRNDVWPGIPFIHETSWEHLGSSGPGIPIRSSNTLHLGLLYGVLGLLFVETWFAWHLGRR